jgi:hypothetical protein
MDNFNDAVLAKLMILEYSEPKLFRQLFEWQTNQEGIPNEISIIEEICKEKSIDDIMLEIKESEYKDWNRQKVIKWLQVEPFLTGIDLRDYYWIARDKIDKSITASSLIPPLVKSFFNELLPSNMPATLTKSLFNEKYSNFSEIEKDAFCNLLSSNLKRNSKQKRLYDIFNIMVEENIENAKIHYTETLKVISIDDIEPAVAMRLADFKSDSVIGEFLREYFNDGKTKASKAFNIKK